MTFEQWYQTFWKWGSSTDEARAKRAFDKARESDSWLIWSLEHSAWWSPGQVGYTRNILQAGRYTHAEAEQICADANRHVPNLQEVALIAPD